MFTIGQRIQTKYGTCLIKSETQMEVVNSNDDAHPNGTIIEIPAIEIKQIKQIKQEKVSATPKTPKTPVKSAAEELAEAEAELNSRKAQLAALLG
jgi:hypothetical protein